MIASTPKRLRMIEQAMKDRAPGMYRELKESGMLQRVLEDHNEAMVEAFEYEYNQAKGEILRAAESASVRDEQTELTLDDIIEVAVAKGVKGAEPALKGLYEIFGGASLKRNNSRGQLETEQALTMAKNAAWHDTLATWLEFEDTEEQKLAYINGSPEIQRRLERAYQKWMDGVDPEHREEFQECWDCEQKQVELNWILEELSMDDH